MDLLNLGGLAAPYLGLAVGLVTMAPSDQPGESLEPAAPEPHAPEPDAPEPDVGAAHGVTRVAVKLPLGPEIVVTSPSVLLSFYFVSLVFVSVLVFMLKPAAVTPVTVRGKVDASRPSDVRVSVGKMWDLSRPRSDGTVDGLVRPEFEKLDVELIVPDRSERVYPHATRSEGSNVLDFGVVPIGEVPPPPENLSQVKDSPPLPPIAAGGQYR